MSPFFSDPEEAVPAPDLLRLWSEPRVDPFVGTTVRVFAEFTISGQPVDVPDVQVRVTDPLGDEVDDLVVEADSIGRSFVRVPTTAGGLWCARIWTEGDAAMAEQHEFYVRS